MLIFCNSPFLGRFAHELLVVEAENQADGEERQETSVKDLGDLENIFQSDSGENVQVKPGNRIPAKIRNIPG